MFERSTRWRVAIAITIALSGVGVWLGQSLLFVAAMVPIVFVAYSALTSAPAIDAQLVLTRTIRPRYTYAGRSVSVTLTVENQSTQTIPDLRIVDGVPAELAVEDGSPRAGLTLRSGETATIDYTVRSRYGEFQFEPATIRTQSLSAASIYTTTVAVSGDTQLTAQFDPQQYPLRDETTALSGGLVSDRANEGLEFHSIRAYQPGDPITRINWRQYARERVLSTIDYREEEATEVILLVDARVHSAVARTDTSPTGTELCVSIAAEAHTALLDAQNRVGAVAFGVDDAARSWAWAPPQTGRRAQLQIEQCLDAAAATVAPSIEQADRDEEDPAPQALIEQLPTGSQVLFVSPLCDSYPLELIRQLEATGHPVTVYSPDVTGGETAGGQLEAIRRSTRVETLQKRGVTVVDWDPDEPLSAALSRGAVTGGGIGV